MAVDCPMCLKSVPNLKSGSHILPRFFLRPIRDVHGRIRVIDVFKAIVDGKTQDLPKGTFICEPCETKTAAWDGYAANMLKDPRSQSISVQPVKFGKIDYELWKGINFKDFRDFALSVVVRDHCWRKSTNMTPLMNDREFEGIRNALMDASAANDSLPIIVHRIREVPAIPNLNKTTSSPVVSMTKDAITFMGMGYGFMVYFKEPVTPGMTDFTEMFRLKSDGSIRMHLANLFDIGTWKHSEKAIKDAYEKHVSQGKS